MSKTERSQALIIVGHGSHLSADSSAPVYAHAERIRSSRVFDEVVEAFWKEEPALRDALSLVESDDVYVVPLFLAEGYFTRGVVPRELGLDRWMAESDGRRVHYCQPVGAHASMEALILRRAAQACGLSDAWRREAALVIIGHGTERSGTSGDTVHGLVRVIRERNEFGHVDCGFLDEEPAIATVVDAITQDQVVLVPFFVAEGWHTRSTIPEALELRGPRTRRGARTLWYTDPVGTSPEMADAIIEVAHAAGARRTPGAAGGAAGESWRRGAGGAAREREAEPACGAPAITRARAAFLDWIESADANGRVFLQVRIRMRPDFTYELRHEADTHLSTVVLERFSTPSDGVGIARSTGSGRYRPLRTAPDLRKGWVLEELTGQEAWEAISLIYPAAALHWYLGRSGAVRPVPFEAVAKRQTGIYARVGKIRGAALGAVIRSCCSDCLRQPAWQPAAGTLGRGADTSAGDDAAAVPCSEACSLFISKAREALPEVRVC